MAKKTGLIWHGAKARSVVMRGLDDNARFAAMELRDRVKKTLSVPGNGVPSSPGRPPHKQTGNLYDSIEYVKLKKGEYRVGPNVRSGGGRGSDGRFGKLHKYAFFLEHGTRFMAPRPWFRPTLIASKAMIKRKLSRKVRER